MTGPLDVLKPRDAFAVDIYLDLTERTTQPEVVILRDPDRAYVTFVVTANDVRVTWKATAMAAAEIARVLDRQAYRETAADGPAPAAPY